MIKSPFNGTFWEKVINHIDHTFLTRIYPSQETVTVFQKSLRSHRKCIVHPRQELILNILEKMEINAKNYKGLYLMQFYNSFLFLKWMSMQISKC